jgi:hypothetical protein
LGKGSNTTTTSTSANPQAAAAYSSLLDQAATTAATPYTPYGNELVAPVNQQQSTGIAGINQYANAAQPAIQTAEGMATSAAAPITAGQIQNYESPYTQQVVDATQAQFNNQNQQQQEQVQGNAIAQGAMGGNREAIAQAETANQQQLAQAPVIAGLENQGYQTGLNTALTEQQAQQAGAYSLGNLGVAGQSAALTGANAQVGAGTLQQSTQQNQDTAAYQQFLNQLAYPFQTEQWAAGIDTGVGSQLGGTSSTTAPAPSIFGQLLGGLTSGVGILGGTGAFGSSGYLNPSGVNSQGASTFLATGGAVEENEHAEGIANRHPTVPESRATLRLQQQQLVHGHRRVQMFPRGTAELPLPHGFHRLAADGAVFHFDPHRISATAVRHASSKGHEHEILDLGPVSKHEVMKRLHGGEIPIAVVERHPDGTEVRAAAGTHLTAPHQLAAMNRTKSPGHTVRIEDPRATLGHRLRNGGHVPHYDLGGATPYAGAGAGAGVTVPGMPYSGGKSWIPSNSITHGQGAPRPPQATDPNAQMKQVAAAAGALRNPNQGVSGNNPATVGINPQGQFTSGPGVNTGYAMYDNGTPTGIMGVAPFAPAEGSWRGGKVPHYDDGGNVPYGQDYFDNEFAAPLIRNNQDGDIASDPSAMAAYNTVASADAVAANPDQGPSMSLAQVPLPTARPAVGVVPDGNINLPPEITAGASRPPSMASAGADQPLAFDTPSISVPASNNMPPPSAPPQTVGVAPPANSPAIDWSQNSKLWPALMSAGFGMMASRSPFPGVAIGEGGQAGVAAYAEERKEEEAAKIKQADIDLEARKLDQEAKQTQQQLAIATMPYNQQTAEQKAQNLIRQQTLGYRMNADGSMTPIPGGPADPAVISNLAAAKGELWKPVVTPDGTYVLMNSKTGEVRSPSALNGSQSQTPPAAGSAPVKLASADGIVPANTELAQQPYNYAHDAPYIEKGMDVPDPTTTAGKSVQSIKTDAEYYLQTGKLPPVSRGQSPVAIQQNNYRNAVENYGNSMAQSRGLSPQDTADMWRTAPGMLKFILGPDGRTTVALGTAVRHLDTLQQLSDAYKAGDVQTVNKIRAALSREFGDDAATNLTTAAHIVGPEIIKGIGIAGAGSTGERDDTASQFSTAKSPEQIAGAIKVTQKLLAGQLEGRERQAANAGVSHDRFVSMIGDRPYEVLKNIDHTQPASNASQQVPALADREIGKVYQTPKGPMRWQANGWFPAQ